MADQTLEKKFEVLNEYGIHARPAALLVKAAGKYDCDIFIEKDGNRVSCKSIMGLMTIEGYPGSIMTVTTSGADAREAMDEIEELFVNKFGED
ncbi:HPr family phosphocarrier protein [Pontiella agarivorans]|uniref:HPr family phosphocarrier protein n=1 Tax=Pontiella agarivorans TaxID=3038953 RepID=A0ABU5N0V2_9BACT|nr:HPr family phosphocarrier protein [Pontiella agarivorans]MDZ8120080.1 HPr family phosphocarrier protein [Pontiella agarivorans]